MWLTRFGSLALATAAAFLVGFGSPAMTKTRYAATFSIHAGAHAT